MTIHGTKTIAEQTQWALETRLMNSTWRAGARLSSGRVQGDSLGVSRNSLREAIVALKAPGHLGCRPHTPTRACAAKHDHPHRVRPFRT